MIYKTTHTEKASPLFKGWQESLIWSCLQNVMGDLYVDSLESPASAIVVLGDFCFPAGTPSRELILHQPWPARQESFCDSPKKTESPPDMIIVPQNSEWGELIEHSYGEKAQKVTRYGIKKEPGIFNLEKLQTAVNTLPDGYALAMIDEKLFWKCREIPWCQDWVKQYEDYALYEKHGLGAVILRDGEPVSGASSYSGYRGGIEIEIITREDHRRKGLAYVCGAKLILECTKRSWYPSWDAQNKWSASLAEKLGYHFDHEYPAYEIKGKVPAHTVTEIR